MLYSSREVVSTKRNTELQNKEFNVDEGEAARNVMYAIQGGCSDRLCTNYYWPIFVINNFIIVNWVYCSHLNLIVFNIE